MKKFLSRFNMGLVAIGLIIGTILLAGGNVYGFLVGCMSMLIIPLTRNL
jgi:hypothetical protein